MICPLERAPYRALHQVLSTSGNKKRALGCADVYISPALS